MAAPSASGCLCPIAIEKRSRANSAAVALPMSLRPPVTSAAGIFRRP
jgi:hypothetical protein